MTQRTGKVVIGDGFDKTLKLHFFQTGGHMGCLYEVFLYDSCSFQRTKGLIRVDHELEYNRDFGYKTEEDKELI